MPVFPAIMIKCDHPGCDSFCITADVSNPQGYAVNRRPLYDPDPVKTHGWELEWRGPPSTYPAGYSCLCPHHRTVDPQPYAW